MIDSIEQAVVSGDYPRAERLWNAYIDTLQQDLHRGLLTAASLEQARELMEWSRITVDCARAHTRARLGGLRIAGAYCNAIPPHSPQIVHARL